MNIKDFLNNLTPVAVAEFAARAETTVGHLAQLKGGHRKPSPEFAKRLVAASFGVLTLAELRPDVWGQLVA